MVSCLYLDAAASAGVTEDVPGSSTFDVVAVEIILIANVQPRATDYRVRPRRSSLVFDRKAALLPVSFRCGLSKAHDIGFAEQVKHAVRVRQTALADGAVFPRRLTRRPIQARQNGVRRAVHMSIQVDDTTVVVLHVSAEIHFLRLDFARA